MHLRFECPEKEVKRKDKAIAHHAISRSTLFHCLQGSCKRWDVVMAASTVMTVPVVALFLAFERFLEQGLVAGGVKG